MRWLRATTRWVPWRRGKPGVTQNPDSQAGTGSTHSVPAVQHATIEATRCPCTTSPSQDRIKTWGRALVASLPVLPVIAAITSLLAAVAPASKIAAFEHVPWITNPLIVGILITVCLWLVAGFFSMPFVSPDTANPTSYSTMVLRINRIDALLCALQDAPADVAREQWDECKAEATMHRETLCHLLQQRGLIWATSTGYIAAWEAVHSAEEALLHIQPLPDLLEQAYVDELRVTGSSMSNQTLLLATLKSARTALQAGERSADEEAQARAAITAVHRAVNDFRDSAWSGMVRSRGRLIVAMIAVGILADLIIALTIVEGASQPALGSALAFFLVSAIVGCFSLLSDRAATNSSVEDYGLANARLLMRPLYSGLAGIGGVVLIAMLSPIVTTTVSGSQSTIPITVTPTATPTRLPGAAAAPLPTGTSETATTKVGGPPSSQTANAVNTPGLDQIFDLRRHPFSLLLAAIFGLTPSLLVDRLLQQTQQYQTNLRSSEASSQEGFVIADNAH